MNPAALVRHYQRFNRGHLAGQLEWFRSCPSLETAIEHAALAMDGKGKRFAHQRRLTHQALAAAKDLLLGIVTELKSVRYFEQVIHLVGEAVAPIDGLGGLYVYDTALRIGAKVGVLPEKVYLHSGTRKGAKALGLDWKAETLGPSALPEWLRVLPPHEVEDFLCIYADKLAGGGASGAGDLNEERCP